MATKQRENSSSVGTVNWRLTAEEPPTGTSPNSGRVKGTGIVKGTEVGSQQIHSSTSKEVIRMYGD